MWQSHQPRTTPTTAQTITITSLCRRLPPPTLLNVQRLLRTRVPVSWPTTDKSPTRVTYEEEEEEKIESAIIPRRFIENRPTSKTGIILYIGDCYLFIYLLYYLTLFIYACPDWLYVGPVLFASAKDPDTDDAAQDGRGYKKEIKGQIDYSKLERVVTFIQLNFTHGSS